MAVRKRGESWQVDVVGPDGTRHRKSFKVKADALSFEYEAKAGKAKPSPVSSTSVVTLRDAMDLAELKVWRGTKAEQGSIRRGQSVVDYFGPTIAMSAIDFNRVEGFVDHLRSQKLSGATINRKLAALSTAFKMARRIDPHIPRPDFPKQKEGRPRQRVLTDEEAAAMLAWEGWTPVHKAMTVFLLKTGARFSECFGQIKLEDRYCTFIDTKNGTDRTIKLTSDAFEAFPVFRKGMTKDGYWGYERAFSKMRGALGFGPDVVIYTLRHTCLTKLAEKADGLLIQKWAGHKSIATTQRYVKATKRGMDALAKLLE